MKGSIAWVRLTVFLGSNILLLTEFYRLSLILLRLIIIAPPLMAFLQNIVQWGLLLGFSCFTLGLYRILRTYPPVLDLEVYSLADLNIWARISLFTSILLLIKILLPPTTLVSPEVYILFSVLVSTSWFLFYFLVVSWIFVYWRLVSKKREIMTGVVKFWITIHLVLGIFIVFYWFLETTSLIFFQEAISTIDPVNITSIALLVLFLFNQIILFYRVTIKFCYSIYG